MLLLKLFKLVELAFQRGERAGQARHGLIRMAQCGRNAFAGIAERCKYLCALARAGSNVRLQLGARGGVERVGPLAGGKLNVGDVRLHAAVFLSLRAKFRKLGEHFLHLALMFGLLRLAQALMLLLRVICLPCGFLQLCAQLGNRLLRGGQPFFERVLRAGRGRIGLVQMVTLALGLGKLTDGWTTQNLFCVYRSSLTDWLTYPRFFLHVLGHPDFAAYCSNIVILLVVGPMAEERFGGKRILLAIALTALVTGLVLWFFFPNSALMGASGVVFMLIVLASFAGMRTGTIPLTLILVLILYLGGEIFQAVTGSAGLAQLTHIAGGVLGMIFGFTWSRGKRGGR